MHEGQSKFYEFMMDKMLEDRKEEGSSLLKECFERQQNGTFTMEYLYDVNIKLLALMKPESKGEVKEILDKFAENQSKQ